MIDHMQRAPHFLYYIVIIFITFLLVNSFQKREIKKPKNTSEKYEIQALKLPNDLNLAGERVPLENDDVRERMDRELLVNTYWQSNGCLLYTSELPTNLRV